ncbi:hypothetical protein [Brevibacillus reuszeri]
MRVMLMATVCLLGVCFLRWMPLDRTTGAEQHGTTFTGGLSVR